MMSASAQPESQGQPPATSSKTAPLPSTAPPTTSSQAPTSNRTPTRAHTLPRLDSTDITAAPPQPPLPPSDPPFTLPAIVHGIDPADEDDEEEEQTTRSSGRGTSRQQIPASSTFASATTHQPSVSEVLSSFTARVQRAVRFNTADKAHAPPTASLLLFGDSITERAAHVTQHASSPGWATLLRETYNEQIAITVRGHSGYNSRWALHVLPTHLQAMGRAEGAAGAAASSSGGGGGGGGPLGPPTHATILLGTNDATEPTSPQYVPYTEYATNLQKMVRYLRAHSITPILITPPPLGTADGETLLHGRTTDSIALYAQTCITVAEHGDVPLINLHAQLLQAARQHGLSNLFVDGVHLSSLGNREACRIIAHGLGQVSPHFVPGNKVSPFPLWTDINPLTPSDALGVSELVDS